MSFFNQLWDNTAGGLLWKPLKKATGLTDAQMIGLGAMAVAAPYALPAMGAMGASGAAGAGQAAAAGPAGAAAGQGGLLSSFGQYAGPASQALNIANQTKAMAQGQPMQAPPAQFQQGQGFSSLLTPVDQFDPDKRRRDQQLALQGLLGVYRG